MVLLEDSAYVCFFTPTLFRTGTKLWQEAGQHEYHKEDGKNTTPSSHAGVPKPKGRADLL